MEKFDIDLIPGFEFDAERLLQDFMRVKKFYNIHENQFNIFHRDEDLSETQRLLEYTGSLLLEYNKTDIIVQESDFKILHYMFKDTYIAEVCEIVRNYSPYLIGRVRILILNPKSCYSWHVDPDLVRYHIPIKTSKASFFIVEDGVFKMQEEGKLYSLISTKWHTALNAHFSKQRIHIVFNTYDPNKENPYLTMVDIRNSY